MCLNRTLPQQFLAVVFCLALLGCDGGPFDYVPVQGRLTYEDGSAIPAGGIKLQFVSMDVEPKNGAYPRPASADVDAEGRFPCTTSYKYGDGLVQGKHKVAIFYAIDKKGDLLVPKDYTHAATTPLVIDAGDSPLELKVPRP